MASLASLSKAELLQLKSELDAQYTTCQANNLSLDMSRGKPTSAQLDLSNDILKTLDTYITKEGIDARNYGILGGITEARELFSELLDIPADNIIIGGNSSLNLIYDAFVRYYIFGSLGHTPWGKLPKVKILCPVPGYDRHFSICEEFGFEMISIPMDSNGPDIDIIENLVKSDDSIKGILCVPLYSNPDGVCYSDEVVNRLASMETAASDFKIFWDNAYAVHHIYHETKLRNIFTACKEHGTEDRIVYFFSTSKITFPGSGVALVAGSDACIAEIKSHFGRQTIGYNKINQLRTYQFFKSAEGIKKHMWQLADILRPKFDIVLNKLDLEFSNSDILTWTKPLGGYFISVNTMPGCAKETVRLARETGLILTDAGATYPYHNDPMDSNIRIAPSYPSDAELTQAIDVFCVCVKLAAVNKLLNQ